MWPLGHAAVGYLCYSLSTRSRFDEPPDGLAVLVLLVGTQFPDLVDKPLAWYLGVLPHGRSLAHSLLVLVPLCVGLYWLARRSGRGELGIAFAIGALSHSLVDALPALWRADADAGFLLYPIVPPEPYEEGAPTVTGLLLESLTQPWFLLEFVLAALALVLWYRDGCPGVELIRRTGRRLTGRAPDGSDAR